jgi:hypothetical protein
MRLFGCVLTLAVLMIALTGTGSDPASGAAPPSSKLAPVAWLAGSWRSQSDGDQLDEMWSAPSSDSMFGSFRWMKDGKAWMFEMLTIMDEADGVILRIKHFDHKGVGWEEKDQAVIFRLARHDAQSAEFERIQSDKTGKLVYRKPGADELIVEFRTIDDKKENEFRFRRIGG